MRTENGCLLYPSCAGRPDAVHRRDARNRACLHTRKRSCGGGARTEDLLKPKRRQGAFPLVTEVWESRFVSVVAFALRVMRYLPGIK
jgi:hypothetical protein